MSWDSTETKRPCPCGKGTYIIVDRSDDWGRSESYWQMDCPECKKNYSLFTYDFYRSGLYEQGHRWIVREKYEEAQKLQSESKNIQDVAVNRSMERYLPVLLNIFDGKSKKAVWEKLNQHLKPFKSLGTFYQHTKGKDKPEYLGELFYFSNLPAIMEVVGLEDEEICAYIKESELLESKSRVLLSE